jgi:hypothetical protein
MTAAANPSALLADGTGFELAHVGRVFAARGCEIATKLL